MFGAKELKIGTILDTFETALADLDRLQEQEDGKEAKAMDVITEQNAIVEASRATKTRAENVAVNLRNLIAVDPA